MKIFGWTADEDGCAHYRIKQPFDALARHGGHEVQYGTHIGPWARDEADIIVGQRVCKLGSAAMWRILATERQHHKAKLVYELDDDLFSIDPTGNPHAEYFHLPQVRRDMIDCMRLADLVTVSTEPLADVVRSYNRNVVVLPNRITEAMLSVPIPPRWGQEGNGDFVFLGWQGSATHVQDWKVCQPAVADLMQRRHHVNIRFLGNFHAEGLPHARPGERGDKRIWWKRWTQDLDLHYRRVASFDIGLAPLALTPFNRSKSGLRFIEAAALGVPMVCSDVAAYQPWVRHGETGFLVRTDRHWRGTLRDLVNDADMRAEVGAAARRAAADWTIEKTWTAWQDAYAALL